MKININNSLFYYATGVFGITCIAVLLSIFFPYTFSSPYYLLNSIWKDDTIVIVAIDDTTLNSTANKRFNDLDRCDMATSLKNISRGDPLAVGVDIFFSSRSKEQHCDDELQRVVGRQKNIILGTEFDEKQKKILPLFDGKTPIKTIGLVNIASHHPGSELLHSLDIHWDTDRKNTVPLYYRGKDIQVLPLVFSLHALTTKQHQVDIEDTHVRLGNFEEIPHKNGVFQVNFFSETYTSISFSDILNNRFDPEILRDKIVLIGATAHDLHDEFLTPFARSQFMPGVIFHANALNTLRSKKYIHIIELPQQILLTVLISLALLALITRGQSILRSLLGTFFILFATIAGSIFAFMIGWSIDIFPLFAASVFIWLYVLGRKFVLERKSKNEIRSMFSKYLSNEVINELVKNGTDGLQLGGTERNITVFFSDLAGFTDLSEGLAPQELGKILNIYFDAMSQIILHQKGTIDKFIGDAIMAFWNAPLNQIQHAKFACTSALLQQKALGAVQNEIIALGSTVHISMRMGIASGKAVVGNFGSKLRYDYTALGDTVNLSSRLEGINKVYGTKIIMSEATVQLLDEMDFLYRELDTITVKGKTIPIRIYELIDEIPLDHPICFRKMFSEDVRPNMQALQMLLQEKLPKEYQIYKNIIATILLHERGLVSYKQGDFSNALEYFSLGNDSVAQLFTQRCQQFLEQGAPTNWDGVIRYTEK